MIPHEIKTAIASKAPSAVYLTGFFLGLDTLSEVSIRSL